MEDPSYKEQFVPLFLFSEPNQSAVIAKDEVLIKDKNGNDLLSGNAEFRLDFLPKPQIHVYITNKKELNDSEKKGLYALHDNILSGNLFELVMKNSGNQFEGFVINSDLFNHNGPSLTFTSSSEPMIGVGNDDIQMQYVIFHLFNFKKICANKGRYCEDVHLEADNWVVELKSLAKSKNNFEKLKKEGGYGLTHICCFRKKDNTFISGKEAADMLNALHYFFSFAKGNWCNPVCAVGFNSLDRVWESWSSPIESCFSEKGSWFDEHHSEQLENLFPGFMNQWTNKDWKITLQKVIYWYIISNTSRIDAGVILTQSALERLSSEHFKANPIGGSAANMLKNLLCDLDIPIDLTDNTPKLKKLAEDVNEIIYTKKWKEKWKWTNGPIAFTGIRNYLVHSIHIYDPLEFGPAIHDSWNLGLWYLELSLLKLCGYSETYYNRLNPGWIGNAEKVPWEK